MKIKIDKNLIATYLSLNNRKADEYLAKLANQIKTGVFESSDNNEIFEHLNLLEEFVYKVPKETIDVACHIIGKKPKLPVLLRSPIGEIEGKSHRDLILKSIELLEHIRYISPDDVLKLSAQLSLYEDLSVKSKALEITKKFAKYDFNILTKSKIGYGAQRRALDFILIWTREEQLQHFDFVEIVLRELLSSSVEGTTSGLNENADYTITMHSGVVSPTDFLKKMRREAINLTHELYKTTEDPKLKLKLVNIFGMASQTPTNILYGDDVARMISDDIKYLVNIYRKIIFGEKGDEMMDYLGIVETIEQQLYWINKSEKRRIKESEKLREDILKNDLFQLFRLLVGDPITYREEEGWDIAETKRNEEINQLISSANLLQTNEWFERFNKIASQHILIEDWKFGHFKGFLKKLSEVKPDVADNLLEMSFKKNSSLMHFTGGFLDGFRIGAHFKYWDKYVGRIVDIKNIELVNALIYSLNIYGEVDLEKYIRNSDLELLGKIVKQKGKFSFLKKADNLMLHHAIINTLARNYRRAPKFVESLVVEEIKNNSKYFGMYFQQLPFIFHNGWISIGELQPKTIGLLKKSLVELPDVDWHIQEILLTIGKIQGLNSILNIFMKRIQKDAKKKEKLMRRRKERYDSIPYHFNPDLSKFIVEHPDYEKTATEWLTKMTTNWSIYNWHVSHLFQRIGKGFDEILGLLIQKGDDDSLMKATSAMHSIDGVNIDLCIEIVRKTRNKRILDQIGSNIYTTGVVTGEYGLAKAYENKAEALEKYKTDKNKHVKTFVVQMIKSLADSAKKERQRTDEERQLRKIEFEG